MVSVVIADGAMALFMTNYRTINLPLVLVPPLRGCTDCAWVSLAGEVLLSAWPRAGRDFCVEGDERMVWL